MGVHEFVITSFTKFTIMMENNYKGKANKQTKGGETENKGNTTSTPKAQQSLQKGQKDVKARGSESWL